MHDLGPSLNGMNESPSSRKSSVLVAALPNSSSRGWHPNSVDLAVDSWLFRYHRSGTQSLISSLPSLIRLGRPGQHRGLRCADTAPDDMNVLLGTNGSYRR
ncbi:hypothetical protein FOYG_08346 [Fusarium oxysporum NRRL 32931]|uniref:Uncharacterized protein n=1 Tax=Fusarium oxysporum NRRL 32931 TaxID=660029 RepID=W9ICV1_FUSOX|nr:hypothetical protein FOYG_08346 [Fusarium oxysporum NRRL 32931]